MNVIADICVVPIGVGVSVSGYVAECQKIFERFDLKFQLHAYGTNVEGEWDQVFSAFKACHEHIHAMGAPRVSTTIRVGSRTDRGQTMEDKITSVQNKL